MLITGAPGQVEDSKLLDAYGQRFRAESQLCSCLNFPWSHVRRGYCVRVCGCPWAMSVSCLGPGLGQGPRPPELTGACVDLSSQAEQLQHWFRKCQSEPEPRLHCNSRTRLRDLLRRPWGPSQ